MEIGAFARVTHDIVIDNQVAFKAGETLEILAVSPNAERPEYKYVVTSSTLGKRYELSDADLSEVQPPDSEIAQPPGADAQGIPTVKPSMKSGISRHQARERNEEREESESFDEELTKDGVDPKLAATIASEEFQVDDDLGELGPEPGTKLTLGQQFRGEQWAPHEAQLTAHTEMEPGTCPQCGVAVTEDMAECPSCGWHLNPDKVPSLGFIRHDIEVDGVVVFHEGDIVKIEDETPDKQHPEQKYLVASDELLGQKFRLTDQDIYHDRDMSHEDLKLAHQNLENMLNSGALTPAEYQQVQKSISERIAEEKKE